MFCCSKYSFCRFWTVFPSFGREKLGKTGLSQFIPFWTAKTGFGREKNNPATRYDLTPTGQRGKLYEKIFFTFDFHILPEHRRIGDKIFPCRCISIKNGDHL